MPDPLLIVIAVALAVFIFFQYRNSKKRQRETAERQAQMVPGVEIMTNYGVYGTLISVDEDTNIALIETTPGTTLKIHRQTILKVVEPETETKTVKDEHAALDADTPSEAPVEVVEPEFGERAESEVKKPARKSAKKTGE
jgi:preprotein translocase subunit YajC